MKRGHKDPGLFLAEEAMVAPEPITPEVIDEANLEEDEALGVISPVTPLEDPREV